jgi:rhodanese-related sulfurtransferase
MLQSVKEFHMSQTISPLELENFRRAGRQIDLLDVRTPAEFREIHVEGARNVPLDRLDPQAIQAARGGLNDQPLYVICRSGSRGKQACEKLLAAGLVNVVNIEGGTVACEAAGLPVVRGKKTISLERQVRIAAGFLVLVGGILAITVHPYFAGLSAFVGAGLMFAGITDTCGMAMLLARMPWNQVSSNSSTSGAACRVGALLLVASIFSPVSAFAAEAHTKDSLDTVQRGVAEQRAVLVDVREQEEWKKGHLRDARLLPLSALEKGLSQEELAKFLPQGKVIYLHCAAGGRCVKAATILKQQGYDVRPLKPGFDDLLGAGFPTATP